MCQSSPCWDMDTRDQSPCSYRIYILIFFFAGLGFKLMAYTLSHSILLCEGFFWDRVSWTICLVWLQTMILLISATWVARITGMSHQYPARMYNLKEVTYTLNSVSVLSFCLSLYLCLSYTHYNSHRTNDCDSCVIF
jgi:hypothetical protein